MRLVPVQLVERQLILLLMQSLPLREQARHQDVMQERLLWVLLHHQEPLTGMMLLREEVHWQQERVLLRQAYLQRRYIMLMQLIMAVQPQAELRLQLR